MWMGWIGWSPGWVRNRASLVLIWVQFLFGLVCVEKFHPSGAKSGGTDGIGYLRVEWGANNKLICTVSSGTSCFLEVVSELKQTKKLWLKKVPGARLKKAGAGWKRQEQVVQILGRSRPPSYTSSRLKPATSIVMMLLSVGAVGCSIFSQTALRMLMPIKC